MKKTAIAFSAMILAVILSLGFISNAVIYYKDGDIIHRPGHTRKITEIEDYNFAWADEIVIRDGSSEVLPLTMHPVADYPYSHTLSEFEKECNDYTSLFYASDTIIENSFIEALKTYYYILVATDKITDPTQTIREYNEEHGIVYPVAESQYTDMFSYIVYACLKYNLYSVIGSEPVKITRGTTVEGAVVELLKSIMGMEVPSSTDTIEGFSLLFAENYVLEDNTLPISDNPSESEVYYWIRLQAAQKGGYAVPADKTFDEITQKEYDYVTYAYYASVLTGKYEIPVNPVLLEAALASPQRETEIPELVLKSMLDYVSIPYSESETSSSLFEKAKKEGFFNLEKEFYTDIYDYVLTVNEDYDSIWFTEFLLAEELGGDKNALTVTINGERVTSTLSQRVYISDIPGDIIIVKINYNDGLRNEDALYMMMKTGLQIFLKQKPTRISLHANDILKIQFNRQ